MSCFYKIGKKVSETTCWLVCDPKRLMRLIVLFICSVVVIFQLSECLTKLLYPPITTHSHFDINDTMVYPAITFCRDPPYKEEIMAQYGLAYHPKFTSHWRNYPFDTKPLTDLFEEATYHPDEYFMQYGLNGNTSFIEIVSSIHFNLGRCVTLKPLVQTKESFKEGGYSIILQHNMTTLDDTNSEIPPGWHIFIHEAKEPFTERRMKTTGRVEYLYVEVGEEIEIKVTTQQFTMMANRDKMCNNNLDYSYTKCGEVCHWEHVTDATNCSGPWMPDVNMEYCDDFKAMKLLIQNYNNDYENEDCDCLEPCYSVIYSGSAMQRKKFDIGTPSSQVWLYYSSKLVTIIEERPGYDLSQFIADMGGSLGFLLGLSVLGFIGLMEKIITILFLDKKIEENKNKSNSKMIEENLDNSGCKPNLSFTSDTTVELPATLNNIQDK